MNNINKIIILSFLILCGCKDLGTNINRISIGFQDNSSIEIDEFKFLLNKNGAMYVELLKEQQLNSLKNKPIDFINIKINDTLLVGKPIMMAYSRDLDLTPFMYYIEDESRNLYLETLNNEELIFIGLKKNVSKYIKDEATGNGTD